MKKLFTQTILATLVAFTLVACSKTSDTTVVNNTPVTATVKDLMADTVLGLDPTSGMPYSAGKYTYYSIENNAIVSSADSATTKWDLAFLSTKILTNGGTSGSGKGGAFIYKGLFDDIKTIAPDSVFKTDAAPVYAITTGSDKGWYHYDGQTNLITPIAGRVLVIKTASGKYAKLEILSYYKGGVTLSPTDSDADKLTKQRYYTFRYTYQPNGTTTF